MTQTNPYTQTGTAGAGPDNPGMLAFEQSQQQFQNTLREAYDDTMQAVNKMYQQVQQRHADAQSNYKPAEAPKGENQTASTGTTGIDAYQEALSKAVKTNDAQLSKQMAAQNQQMQQATQLMQNQQAMQAAQPVQPAQPVQQPGQPAQAPQQKPYKAVYAPGQQQPGAPNQPRPPYTDPQGGVYYG